MQLTVSILYLFNVIKRLRQFVYSEYIRKFIQKILWSKYYVIVYVCINTFLRTNTDIPKQNEFSV